MPLNEDELRKVFENVALPTIMNGGIKGKWLLRTHLGDYKIDEIEDLWGAFKAAYSPEVLQSLGVVIQNQPLIARSLAEWHEDDGPVMWWAWCGNDWAGEPAWNGSPTDSDWPGYHTHWTPHPIQPQAIKEQS